MIQIRESYAEVHGMWPVKETVEWYRSEQATLQYMECGLWKKL